MGNEQPLAPNRSAPGSTVIPVIGYPDMAAAVKWLCDAFGFEERLRIMDHRTQLSFGGGNVVVTQLPAERGSAASDTPATFSILVRIADADRHCENARRAGAQIENEPTDYLYGERQYSAVDLNGYRWTFSETIADADPREWGGVLVDERR